MMPNTSNITGVSVSFAEIPPLVADVGLLLGLLAEQDEGDDYDFDATWFGRVRTELSKVPGRRAELMRLLRDLLGKPTKDAPKGSSWYALPLEGAPTPVYAVLPEDDESGDASTVGIGIFDDFGKGKFTARAAAYMPLFDVPLGSPAVITGRSGHPIRLTLTKSFGETVTLDKVSFDGIELACELYVDGTEPSFSLTFTGMKPAGEQSTVTTLAVLTDAKVRSWIDAALGLKSVKEWLGRKIGSSTITIGDVLCDAGVLAVKKAKPGVLAAATDGYSLGALAKPAAQDLLAKALARLAKNKNALVKLGKKGGIWVFAHDTDDATEYGLRLKVPGVDLSPKGGPSIKLQLGELLSGDDENDPWFARSDPDGDVAEAEPGVRLTLVSESKAKPPATPEPSWRVKLDLVSVGFDVTGAKEQPLVNVHGVQLSGIEPRFLFSWDANNSKITWGLALEVGELGLPLGNGISGAASNPVAQNLLSSGTAADKAGDPEPVNPTFTVAVAKVFDPVESTELDVQLRLGGVSSRRIWIPVQRSFGPLQCRRIGVEWPDSNPDQRLQFLFDGGVSLGPLAVDLQDLSLGIPLAAPGSIDRYTADLQGLGIAYTTPELSISGGFLKKQDTKTVEYDGAAVIRAAKWSLEAIGSYAALDGQPSLFIFARLGAELGGPPFFFVTGLCAGFGYNRALRMPNRDEVPQFPLLAGIADPRKVGGANATPAQALAALSDWVPPAQGVNWVAAGVQFTSFEIVRSNVVVAAVVGKDFQLAMLGVSRLKLAQTGPQFAYAELGLQAVFHPASGFLGISAQLSPNSYVITEACHLTGGFAFWMWYDGAHAGDFVITLGGYHPAFVKPLHYPDVPRLAFSWQVNGNLAIQGSAYFALTPSCAMGGGALSVEFHSGDLRAWFTAHADFLFTWKPFYFIGNVGVSVGASYKMNLLVASVTVSAELGAELEIWGPPTGGVVRVDWYVISFSVSFGAGKQQPGGILEWDDFTALLPQRSAAKKELMTGALGTAAAAPPVVLTTAISNGLASMNGDDWRVRGDELVFSVDSAFPLTSAVLQGATPVSYAPEKPYDAIAVRPMGIASVKSALSITITGPGGMVNLGAGWKWRAVSQEVPAAMWGAPLATRSPAPSADTLPGRVMGIGAIAPPTVIPTGPAPIPADVLGHAPLDEGQRWLPLSAKDAPVTRQPQRSPTSVRRIAATVADTAVGPRAALFAALASLGVDAGANGDTAAISKDASFSYPDAPMLGAPWTVAA